MWIFTFPVLCLFSFMFLLSCDPLVTTFEDVEDAVMYKAASITEPDAIPPEDIDEIVVMTWNIRFGAARIPWYIDSCGDRVLLTKKEVMTGLEGLAEKIKQVNPDILLLQEVDAESKRTVYVDEVQWLLDHTDMNYGAFASTHQIQFIPSDGMGRIDQGNAILSRWKISKAERIQLPLRGDQSALTQYFWTRRNILKVKIDIPTSLPLDFYGVNIHAAAFSTDDTKRQQIDMFKEILHELDIDGAIYVAGGDLNEIPPTSDSTNFCDEDRCPEDADDFCRDGSDFYDETDWLNDFYDDSSIYPALPLSEYLENNSPHFTHSVVTTGHDWNRKLDYLFTNLEWITGTTVTHQDAFDLSDHAPVSATLNLLIDHIP
ncbi:MAG: endonuclease/exonuclease/phosphatase family protein [Candidatus Marinimicrobia bacterium]|nr:endonuclease/exonuclease/phosphatase family protein [Candidatus Neomarinimicrobiota bacterium]